MWQFPLYGEMCLVVMWIFEVSKDKYDTPHLWYVLVVKWGMYQKKTTVRVDLEVRIMSIIWILRIKLRVWYCYEIIKYMLLKKNSQYSHHSHLILSFPQKIQNEENSSSILPYGETFLLQRLENSRLVPYILIFSIFSSCFSAFTCLFIFL